MQVSWLTCESDAWRHALTQLRHDVFHRPAYVRLAARHEGGEGRALLVQDNDATLLLPLVIKPVASPYEDGASGFDAMSPYGYPGLLFATPPDTSSEAFLDRALSAGLAVLREQHIVSLFVRMHPLLPVPMEVLSRYGTLVRHGDTVFIDVTRPEAIQWDQLRKSTRYEIRQARRAGLHAECDAQGEHFETFVAIYHETMRRVQARPFYFFEAAYFAALREALTGALSLHVVRDGADVAAAALLTESGGMVHYFLGGTRTAALDQNPMKLLLDHARRWAKARGNEVLHLGGGVGAQEDGLFQFKAGFSPDRLPFYTWRVVVAPEPFDLLCRNAGVQARPTDGFFPPYRTPHF